MSQIEERDPKHAFDQWIIANIGQFNSERDRIIKLGDSGERNGERNKLDREIAQLLLNRLLDLHPDPGSDSWDATASLRLEFFASFWFESAERTAMSSGLISSLGTSAEEFCSIVKYQTLSAPCSHNHPIFDHLEFRATRTELRNALVAESLCDLYFVDILCRLMPGMRGPLAAEVAQNLWDEWGSGNPLRFHSDIRRRMMQDVGVPQSFEPRRIGNYSVAEVNHFLAYALNGLYRQYSYRLVGMMFATEYLVPFQLRRVLAGWRRVGVPDEHLEYLLMHIEGDEGHADGWANRVVLPLVEERPDCKREIMIGVHQHLSILEWVYDTLFDFPEPR